MSLISEENFKKIQKNGVSLQESKAKLFTCTGDKIKVKGCSDVRVEHNGQTVKLPLFVTGGSGPSLFGRNWLTALRLDWQGIFAVKKVSTLEEVLEKYQEVFNDELGLLKGATAKIYTQHRSPTNQDQYLMLSYIFGVKMFHQYVYGRLFTLKTDHKPLTYIFGDIKAMPTMASGRIQR